MYKIGSAILKLDNPKDEDYLDITNNEEKPYYRELIDGKDVVHRSQSNIIKFLNYEVDFIANAPLLLYNYQLDRELIGAEFPIEFHLLDHRAEVEKLLEVIKQYKLMNYDQEIYGEGNTCTKRVYHIAATKCFLKNNAMTLTAEQKAIIQKIHDGLMTWEEYKEKVGY